MGPGNSAYLIIAWNRDPCQGRVYALGVHYVSTITAPRAEVQAMQMRLPVIERSWGPGTWEGNEVGMWAQPPWQMVLRQVWEAFEVGTCSMIPASFMIA